MSEPTEYYLFLSGEKQGPYDQPSIDRMLLEGRVQLSDSAWRQGLSDWTTLGRALESDPAPEPPPAPIRPSELRAIAPAEPASAKQKAFLAYMGVAVPANLSKSKAALLVNDAMENPSDPARLAKWHEDRLRLHPEIFAADLQAKKENRPTYFHERVLKEGAECFHDVSKAHCQVLVGYLDVKFPGWDARDTDAAWDYFFPAIAEKFPQLVSKGWKGRLKYPQGPRVAAELSRSAPTAQVVRRPAPVLSGAAFAWIFVLLLLGGAIFYLKQHAPGSRVVAGSAGPRHEPTIVYSTPIPEASVLRETAHPAATVSGTAKASDAALQSTLPPPARVPGSGSDRLVDASAMETAPMAEAPAMTANDPAAMSGAPGLTDPPAAATAPMAGVPGMADLAPTPASASGAGTAPGAPPPLATPASVTGSPSAPPTAVASLPPIAGAPRSTVKLIRPVTIKLTYGQLTIPQGTALRVISQEPTVVNVAYMNSVIPVPLQMTDIGL